MGRRSAWAGVVPLLAVVSLAACGGIPPEPSVVGASARADAPPAVTAAALQPEFDAFLAAHPGEVSLAWAPVGAGDRVQTLGATTDSDAWSTMKVPIAVAALDRAGGASAPEALRGQVRAAIEWSDNEAAEALYRTLGEGDTAEGVVESVLRAGGDARTNVDPDEGENRGFGRSIWRVDDAATYAAHLPCAQDSVIVYDEMGRIREDQRWGLGATGPSARFKGGWGESDHGYLVRQLGTITHDGGRTAVAFVVAPKDHTHETAMATASALVTWLAGRLGPADVGSCPGGDPTPPPSVTGTATDPATDPATGPTSESATDPTRTAPTTAASHG